MAPLIPFSELFLEPSKTTVRELRSFAQERNISLGDAHNKAQIWDALADDEASVLDPATDEPAMAQDEAADSEGPATQATGSPAGVVEGYVAEAAPVVRQHVPDQNVDLVNGNLGDTLSSGGRLVVPDKLRGFNPGQETLLRNRAGLGYHLANGLFFDRLEDGAVTINVTREGAGLPPDGSPSFAVEIDPESWVTVVEEMSGQENSADLHREARNLHG